MMKCSGISDPNFLRNVDKYLSLIDHDIKRLPSIEMLGIAADKMLAIRHTKASGLDAKSYDQARQCSPPK